MGKHSLPSCNKLSIANLYRGLAAVTYCKILCEDEIHGYFTIMDRIDTN